MTHFKVLQNLRTLLKMAELLQWWSTEIIFQSIITASLVWFKNGELKWPRKSLDKLNISSGSSLKDSAQLLCFHEHDSWNTPKILALDSCPWYPINNSIQRFGYPFCTNSNRCAWNLSCVCVTRWYNYDIISDSKSINDIFVWCI